MTLDQRSVSLRMYAASSAGVVVCGSDPWSANRWANDGSANIFTTSAFSLPTIPDGTPRGARRAYQLTHSKPGIVSAIVGSSGVAAERFLPAVASARNFPVLASGSTAGMLLNMKSTWPPTRSEMAGDVPLYGTCTKSTAAIDFSSSQPRWLAG